MLLLFKIIMKINSRLQKRRKGTVKLICSIVDFHFHCVFSQHVRDLTLYHVFCNRSYRVMFLFIFYSPVN